MNDTATPQITIYSTTWCAFCKTEKQWLDHLGIPYISKNIEEDEAAHAELMSKLGGDSNFQGVPVTDVAGDIVLGFDRPKLQGAMDSHGIKAKV
jgi:glutaredoxin